MHPLSRVLLLVTLLILTFNGSAQQSSTTVPNLIRYGGVVKDGRGAAIASRTVGITFLIYGQQDGGAPVWLETQNVATDALGQYSVLLGSTTATGLPGDLFAQQDQRWLAVKAEGQPEQPRVLLVSVPYAMKAAVADTLAGHSVSEFVTTDNLKSAVKEQLQGQATTTLVGVPAGTTNNSPVAGNAPVPTNPATNFVDNTTNQVVQVTQNGTGFGLNASANTPTGVGVLGTVSSSPKAGISAGVEGTSSINNGFGMFGYSTATSLGVGVQGRSDSSNGTGVRGWTIGTSGIAVNATSSATTGNPVGLYASVSAPGGTGALITNIASGTITGPLINALTNNVTQFAVGATGNVSATGWLSGKQLISTVATGTAPLQVTSATQVPNLNASLLGGNAASAFASASGSPNYIQNGTALQSAANFNIGGNGSANRFNSATSYEIGGSSALSVDALNENLFVGVGAGASNTTGGNNTFSGFQAGYSNTTGILNTFVGVQAGFSNIGNANTFIGYGAGYSNGPGVANTFAGIDAGGHNTFGMANAFYGYSAGQNNTTGNYDIYVSNSGPSSGNESNTIRIGDPANQTAAYIAGISGAATNTGVPVFIDAMGKLGAMGGSLGGVTSFNGRTGAVLPAANDYSLPQIAGTLSFLRLSGTLGNSQLIGTYTNALTLNNASNSFTGSFTGNGANLTGVPVSAGSSNYIQNGTVQQLSANFNISGNGTANTFNSATSYQIGSSSVLTIGSVADNNLFLGVGAGASNVAGSGVSNLFSGSGAGILNTTGSFNTFSGYGAGANNTTGTQNAFYGNVAGAANVSGSNNVFVGSNTGQFNTTGGANTFSGSYAGNFNSTGSENTFYGVAAGKFNTTGMTNIFLGDAAGADNTTGSNDIYIGNFGPNSGSESNTIRIGMQGNGHAQQNTTLIAGIWGSTIQTNGIPVYVDSNGQLGTIVSSRRFKEQIRDMGDSTNGLVKLRPVTFLYKPEYDKGPRTLQYGLIAEEVAEVYPDLVAYEPDGKPYTVKYQYLTTMLLNEMQKQYHRAEVQAEVIKTQQQEIDDLKAQLRLQNAAFQERLSRLESMVGTQTQIAADLPHR